MPVLPPAASAAPDRGRQVVQGQCLPVGHQIEDADLQRATGIPGLLFGEAEACDLRPTVGAARDEVAVQGMHAGYADDVVDADDRLVAGLVGQTRRARHVADRVEPGDGGASPLVRDDEPPVEPDPEFGQTEPSELAATPVDESTVAVRTEIHRIWRAVGGLIETNPYRPSGGVRVIR